MVALAETDQEKVEAKVDAIFKSAENASTGLTFEARLLTVKEELLAVAHAIQWKYVNIHASIRGLFALEWEIQQPRTLTTEDVLVFLREAACCAIYLVCATNEGRPRHVVEAAMQANKEEIAEEGSAAIPADTRLRLLQKLLETHRSGWSHILAFQLLDSNLDILVKAIRWTDWEKKLAADAANLLRSLSTTSVLSNPDLQAGPLHEAQISIPSRRLSQRHSIHVQGIQAEKARQTIALRQSPAGLGYSGTTRRPLGSLGLPSEASNQAQVNIPQQQEEYWRRYQPPGDADAPRQQNHAAPPSRQWGSINSSIASPRPHCILPSLAENPRSLSRPSFQEQLNRYSTVSSLSGQPSYGSYQPTHSSFGAPTPSRGSPILRPAQSEEQLHSRSTTPVNMHRVPLPLRSPHVTPRSSHQNLQQEANRYALPPLSPSGSAAPSFKDFVKHSHPQQSDMDREPVYTPLSPTSRFTGPSSFRVQEGRNSASRDLDDANEFQALATANDSRAIRTLATEIKIISLLSEPAVPTSDLKSTLPQLNIPLYQDVVAERLISNLCGYPTCSNLLSSASRRPRSEGPVLRLAHNRLLDVSERSKYCSQKCFQSSEWLQRSCLGMGHSQLLEELDHSRSTTTSSSTESTSSSSDPLPAMSDLTIVENEIPPDKPAPPTLGQPDFEAPSQQQAPKAASRFILGRKMKEKTSKLSSPAPVESVMATPKAKEPKAEEEVIPVAYPEEKEVPAEQEDSEVEEDYLIDDFREILYAGLALRKSLRDKGEMD